LADPRRFTVRRLLKSRNVVAAGGCELITRRRRYRLRDPEIIHDEARLDASRFARPILRLIGAADFMRLRADA